MKKVVNVGVCSGRHKIEGIEKYVFDSFDVLPSPEELLRKAEQFFEELLSPMTHDRKCIEAIAFYGDGYYEKWIPDVEIHLYVTGFTPMTLAIVRACQDREFELVCHHFDRETGEYYPQTVLKY